MKYKVGDIIVNKGDKITHKARIVDICFYRSGKPHYYKIFNIKDDYQEFLVPNVGCELLEKCTRLEIKLERKLKLLKINEEASNTRSSIQSLKKVCN